MARSYLPSGIRRNNTKVQTCPEANLVRVTLHQTCIAIWDRSAGSVTLNTGGWNTPTTIRRMNECLHHWGFRARVCKADFVSSHVVRITGGADFRGVSVMIPRTWTADEESAARRALLRAGVPTHELTMTRGGTDEPCIDVLHPEGAESALSRVLVGDPVEGMKP